ncbi:hypothetical protein VC273_12465 [Xanthomonas nasturtii]|nr:MULTISPECIES: hypothetical protein [Xanthomonas]MEA9556694.1 hypothetical protein [Xanthomonas nasturtii]
MPLFTLTVRYELGWFSTQLTAPNAQAGVVQFFDKTYPSIREDAFGALAPDVRAADLVLFIPMEGLTNVWAATAGSHGKYVEVVCCRTIGDN